MARVMETSTLPAAPRRRPLGDDQEARTTLAPLAQLPTVQGLVVGRSLLYPADGDVAAAVDTAVDLCTCGGRAP